MYGVENKSFKFSRMAVVRNISLISKSTWACGCATPRRLSIRGHHVDDVYWGTGGGRLVAAGGVGSMVIVAVVPHCDDVAALLL